MITPPESSVAAPMKKRGRPPKGKEIPQAVQQATPMKSAPDCDKENVPISILNPTPSQKSSIPKTISQDSPGKTNAAKESPPLPKPQPLQPSKGTPQAANRLKQPFKLALSEKENTPTSSQRTPSTGRLYGGTPQSVDRLSKPFRCPGSAT